MNRLERALDAAHQEYPNRVTELEIESHLGERFFHRLKKIIRALFRYFYKDRTFGCSELVKAAREIESDLEEVWLRLD